MFRQQKRKDLKGERKKEALRVQFDSSVSLEFHGSKLTSDGGLLVYRELDEVLGLTMLVEEGLQDARTGQNTQHTLTALLRQSVYGRLAGYEDTNDATGGGRSRQGAPGGFDQPDGADLKQKYCPAARTFKR